MNRLLLALAVLVSGTIAAVTGPRPTAADRTTPRSLFGLQRDAAACRPADGGEDAPGLYVARADGSGATCVGPGSAPEWSPDGARLAFADGMSMQAIRVVMADGSGERRVEVAPTISGPPAWSPTGARFAFVGEEDLVVVGLDGSVLATVPLPFFTPDAAGGDQVASIGPALAKPAWSPDGARLAFADYDRTDGGVGAEIYAVAADGSGKVQLTDFPVSAQPLNPSDAPGPPFATADASSPAWSPDGTRVAFALVESFPGAEVGVGVVGADGSGQRLVADVAPDSGPSWSPDGTRLLFGSWRGAVADVWIVGADGSGLANLTAAHDGQAADPAWSPDGARIAFVALPPYRD